MSSGPTQNYDDPTLDGWRPRPVLAAVVRVFVFTLPPAVAIVLGWVAATWFPAARFGLNPWLWLAAEVAVSTVAVLALGRLTRRLLPLSALLAMALVFPDQAPSRLSVALRTHSPAALRRRIDDVNDGRHATVAPGQEAHTTELLALVAALSLHDHATRGHSERVQGYTSLIADEMRLSEADAARLRWAALLHDIGKLHVPAEVLNNQGRPSESEWAVLATHPHAGLDLVAPLSEFLGEWVAGISQHHERWDGEGYPLGLSGQQIHLGARIIAVADTYDVITSTRSYKRAMPASQARAELARCSGSQFDPTVVRSFMAVSIGKLRLNAGPLSAFTGLPGIRNLGIENLAHTVGGASSALSSGVAATTAALGLLLGALAAPAVANDPSPAAEHGAVVVAQPPRPFGPPGSSTGGTSGANPDQQPAADATEPADLPVPDAATDAAPDAATDAATDAAMTPDGAATAPTAPTPPPAAPAPATPSTGASCQTVTADELDLCDLAGATLVGDWTGVNLAGRNLSSATLDGVTLTGATLNAADLTGARLTHVTLTGARLQGTDLSGARLDRVDLTRADLTNASLARTSLSGTVLADAVLVNASLRDATAHDPVSLRGADLGEAALDGASLRGADLTGADLKGAELVGTDLTGARLGGADLTRADLTGAVLVGADVEGSALASTTLSTTNFSHATGTPGSTTRASWSATVCPSGETTDTGCW